MNEYTKEKNIKEDTSAEDDIPISTDKQLNFDTEKAFAVYSDIIDSTRLYNKDPFGMKNASVQHHVLLIGLIKKYHGSHVGFGGDSYQMLFPCLSNAIDFAIELLQTHTEQINYFKIKIGICKGPFQVRKLCGYELFGDSVDEIEQMVSHNPGNCICIKKSLLKQYKKYKEPILCIHDD